MTVLKVKFQSIENERITLQRGNGGLSRQVEGSNIHSIYPLYWGFYMLLLSNIYLSCPDLYIHVIESVWFSEAFCILD